MNIKNLSNKLTVDLSCLDLLVITAQLDLALKCPTNTGPSSKSAKMIGQWFVVLLRGQNLDIPQEVMIDYTKTFEL